MAKDILGVSQMLWIQPQSLYLPQMDSLDTRYPVAAPPPLVPVLKGK